MKSTSHLSRVLARVALILLPLTCCHPSLAQSARWRSGRASFHSYPHRGYVTAARGVPRGSVLEVRSRAGSIRVRVVDACGFPMRRMHRHLDLNPRAFKALFGTTRRGVGPVRFRLVKRGHGASTGRAW